MRISLGMIADTSLRNMEANQARIDTLEAQITSGTRITKPSDDPIGTARALGFQETIDQSNQYLRNIDQATSWLNNSESALSGVTQTIQRSRELAVQAANGTLSVADLASIQAEITQLQKEVLDQAHTKFGAYYVFSGSQSGNPGYSSSVAGAYLGNNGQRLDPARRWR
jgi:flagellar hook-associated protein 3 FlgL